MGRAQRSLDLLAERVTARGLKSGPLCGDSWNGADIAVLTIVIWFEGLPARAVTFPLAKRITELGWTLPTVLSTRGEKENLGH